MWHTLLTVFLNHSIIIAAVIAVFRFKAISSNYYPFIILIWLGLLNESISLALISGGYRNTVNSNVFVLCDYLLILLQFYKWNRSGPLRYYIMAAIGFAVWTTDNFIMNSIDQNNSVFRVFYSFIVVFFSIDKINSIIIFENLRIRKNATFLICAGFIFYYILKACVESFNMIHLGLTGSLLRKFWFILYIVNFITNLLFALAVLWIPTRQRFILRY
jgi:hypothetical protein